MNNERLWKGDQVLELLGHYAPLAGRREQMNAAQVARIAGNLVAKNGVNLLVFGLGIDSPFWCACNRAGRTVFLENDPEWIEKIRGTIPPTAEIHRVTYTTIIGYWQESPGLPAQWPDALKGVKWDVILVDAPSGYRAGTPGRQQSIYTAAQLRSPTAGGAGGAIVYVHDYERDWERRSADAYLGKPATTLPGTFGTLAEWS